MTAILVCLNGCTFYDLHIHPAADLQKQINRPIILHYKDFQIYLNQIKLTQTAIEGDVAQFFNIAGEPDNSIHDQAQALEAHIYLESLEVSQVENGKVLQIPFNTIHTVKLYDVNAGKTILTYVAIGGGICAIAAVTVMIVALAEKQSCPFIYAYDGKTYDFVGEIFSGAIYPNLERNDYLPLYSIKPVDGKYSLQITNEVKEIQHTNLMELCIVDHPVNTRVLFDRNGTPFTMGTLQLALSCIAPNGRDVSVLTNAADSLTYTTNETRPDQVMDSLVFTFNRVPEANKAKLFIRAKNLFWLDYVYGQFLDLFGDKIKAWNASRQSIPREKILEWCRKQGLLLMVYVDEGKGWRPVDYCDEVGPMALRNLVIPVTLAELPEKTIRVKLEFGARFWEVDYAAIDYSAQQPVTVTTSPAKSAFDGTGGSVLDKIKSDDKNYYDQPHIGDRATITFSALANCPSKTRTVFLHSKGYYDILRNPGGKPDLAYLQRFRKPGEMVRFANDRLKVINEETKNKGN
jgi:hypothetical protein